MLLFVGTQSKNQNENVVLLSHHIQTAGLCLRRFCNINLLSILLSFGSAQYLLSPTCNTRALISQAPWLD